MTKSIFDFYNDWGKIYGSCSPLHAINKIRFDYIKSNIFLKGKKILDIGCGGGILSTKLALHGAFVTGIDKSSHLIDVAKNVSNKNIYLKYINIDILKFNSDIKYDIILCMEVLEHFSSINLLLSKIKDFCNTDTQIFISSLDKNFKCYLDIIFFGEYVIKKLHKGTHFYNDFIDIRYLLYLFSKFNYLLQDIKFIKYNLLTNLATMHFVNFYNYIVRLKIC